MQWLNACGLLVLAGLLCLGNLRETALRSTIPLAIDDTVVRIEIRQEKHPGRDDVYLVHWENSTPQHIDEQLASQLQPGDLFSKLAGQAEATVNAEAKPLNWSQDYLGMQIVMPASLLSVLVAAAWAIARSRRREDISDGVRNKAI